MNRYSIYISKRYLLFVSLDICKHITLINFRALFCIYFYQLTTQCGRYFYKFAPRSKNVAELLALLYSLPTNGSTAGAASPSPWNSQNTCPLTGATMASAFACLNAVASSMLTLAPSLASLAFCKSAKKFFLA